MSWRDWAAAIVENAATPEPNKPKKAPIDAADEVNSVFSVPPPAHFGVMAEQQAELVGLVNRLADHHGFTLEQRQEALSIALADHVAALECFRMLAAAIPVPEPSRDDRVHCMDCGELRGAVCPIEQFSPVRDVPRRCATFRSKRHGAMVH